MIVLYASGPTMLDKLLNDAAGALLTAHASRELIEDVRQERENVRAWMTTFEARARMLRLDPDELALLAERLDTVLPKLEALERDQHRRLLSPDRRAAASPRPAPAGLRSLRLPWRRPARVRSPASQSSPRPARVGLHRTGHARS